MKMFSIRTVAGIVSSAFLSLFILFIFNTEVSAFSGSGSGSYGDPLLGLYVLSGALIIGPAAVLLKTRKRR